MLFQQHKNLIFQRFKQQLTISYLF